MHQLPPRRVDSPKSRETGNPYFDIPNYLKMSPLVVLDPTQPFIKNITANAYQIGPHPNPVRHSCPNVCPCQTPVLRRTAQRDERARWSQERLLLELPQEEGQSTRSLQEYCRRDLATQASTSHTSIERVANSNYASNFIIEPMVFTRSSL
jgi:hypothetical protein